MPAAQEQIANPHGVVKVLERSPGQMFGYRNPEYLRGANLFTTVAAALRGFAHIEQTVRSKVQSGSADAAALQLLFTDVLDALQTELAAEQGDIAAIGPLAVYRNKAVENILTVLRMQPIQQADSTLHETVVSLLSDETKQQFNAIQQLGKSLPVDKLVLDLRIQILSDLQTLGQTTTQK